MCGPHVSTIYIGNMPYIYIYTYMPYISKAISSHRQIVATAADVVNGTSH